ncbi:MAG: hypothetical protein ABGW91_13105 [Christiangramia sp.]|nr:hypothetical protein [Christiangramia sp.]
MNKITLLLLAIFFHFSAIAQDGIKGRVVSLEDPTGIENLNILNLSSGKGTSSDREGYFLIPALSGDTILFSSVQHVNRKIVVSEAMLKKGSFGEILLDEEINELAEVLVDDIELSGFLQSDINKISVKEVERKNQMQQILSDVVKKDRELNPYKKRNSMGGLDLKKVAGVVAEALEKKQIGTPLISDPKELRARGLEMAGMAYFRKSLGLNTNEVTNFLFFCQKNPIFKKLVNDDNAFALLEYFDSQIDKFREWRGTEFNNSDSLRKEVDSI